MVLDVTVTLPKMPPPLPLVRQQADTPSAEFPEIVLDVTSTSPSELPPIPPPCLPAEFPEMVLDDTVTMPSMPEFRRHLDRQSCRKWC